MIEDKLLHENRLDGKEFFNEWLIKMDKIAKGYDVFQINNDDLRWQKKEMRLDYKELERQATDNENRVF